MQRAGTAPMIPAFGVLAAILFAITIFDTLDGTLYLGDVDDRLRAIQITQFFNGQAWYDLTINGIAMPDAYISPWSRIVDAPYVMIAGVLSFFLDRSVALNIAFHIWPPVMLTGFAWFSTATMTRLLPEGRRLEPLHVTAAAVAMTYAAFEFSPGRIDHHNVQLLALSAMLAGIAFWSFRGAVLAAVAVAVSLNIGLETLPLIAVFWAGVALAWIFAVEGSGRFFLAFSASLAVAALLMALVFAGPRVVFSVENDVFSAPYVAAVAGFSVISVFAVFFLKGHDSPVSRLIVLGVAGMVLLGVILFFMPSVLSGPYHMIDPLSRRLWLEHVSQEVPVFVTIREHNWAVLVKTIVEGVVIVFSGVVALRNLRAGQVAPAIILAVGAAAFVLTLDVVRFIRFPAAVVPLFIPTLLSSIQTAEPKRQARNLTSFAVLSVLVAAGIGAVSFLMPVPREPGVLDAADFLTYDACDALDYTALAGAPKGRYMVPAGMSLSMLERVPHDHTVSNITYHRASLGIRRMFETFLLTDGTARREAIKPFQYLAFCAYPFAVQAPKGSLYEALLAGNDWPGLEPLPVSGAERVRVYKIDHAAFR